MFLRKRIGLIGCGNMGSAMVSALISKQVARAGDVFVFDQDRTKLTALRRKFHIRAASSHLDLVRRAEVIVLAVKPQDLRAVAGSIRTRLNRSKVIVSILAGTTLRTLRRCLGSKPGLVRGMPNLAAQVGEAMTAIAGSDPKALEISERIFNACGRVVRLPEKYFDLVTAVSGSGPAYFFFLMELLVRIGVSHGLSERTARLLAVQTAFGAGQAARTMPLPPARLRAMVASKGGTTEAALRFLEQNRFPSIFLGAVRQALKRSRELSR